MPIWQQSTIYWIVSGGFFAFIGVEKAKTFFGVNMFSISIRNLFCCLFMFWPVVNIDQVKAQDDDWSIFAIQPIDDSGWGPIRNANTGKGGAVCSDGTQNFSCFMLRCQGSMPLEFAYYFSGGDFPGETKVPIFVDGVLIDILHFQAVDPNGHLRANLGSRGIEVISSLKRGTTMAVILGGKAKQYSLRGSSRQINKALRLCRAYTSTMRAKGSSDPTVKIISRIFEANDCIATEEQIFDALSQNMGIAGANSYFVSWTERPDFLSRYKVISRDPFTYQDVTSPFCNSMGPKTETVSEADLPIGTKLTDLLKPAVQPVMPPLETSPLVAPEIAAACDGRKGTIDSAGYIQKDLSGDDIHDVIIQHDAITCENGARSLYCGAQVCSTKIYVWEPGGSFRETSDILGLLEDISDERIPTMRFQGHGGQRFSARWDGNSFRQRFD